MTKSWAGTIWTEDAMGVAIGLVALLLVGGCATPVDTTPSHTKTLQPDQDDDMGGSFLESSDIRTMANQLCTELLTLPQISENPGAVRIVTERIQNSTRYMVDTNLLLRRLRLELNRHSQGQVRFFAQGSGQVARTRILTERQGEQVTTAVSDVAAYIASSDIVQKSDTPIRIAVHPVANTNLFNMNADSFAAMLRTNIKETAGEKILFSKPGSDAEVDYVLTGEFIAQSIKREGIANTVEDLQWAQANPDKFHDADSKTNGSTVHGNQINIDGPMRRQVKIGPNTTYKLIEPSLWNNPNTTKTFNVMLVDNDDIAVLEKSVDIDKQITSGQANADYVLTGDITALSKGGGGRRSDYVLVTLILIDPENNEMLWEYGYEIKRVTSRSVLYR